MFLSSFALDLMLLIILILFALMRMNLFVDFGMTVSNVLLLLVLKPFLMDAVLVKTNKWHIMLMEDVKIYEIIIFF